MISIADRLELFLIGKKNLLVRKKEQLNDFMNDEDGSVVDTVIIMAIVALIAVAVMGLLGGALKGKAQDASNVIGSASFQ